MVIWNNNNNALIGSIKIIFFLNRFHTLKCSYYRKSLLPTSWLCKKIQKMRMNWLHPRFIKTAELTRGVLLDL